MRRIKSYIFIPLVLFIYLVGMVLFFGMNYFYAGEYLFFFGITGTTLAIIIALHFLLKKKERLRKEREDEMNSQK